MHTAQRGLFEQSQPLGLSGARRRPPVCCLLCSHLRTHKPQVIIDSSISTQLLYAAAGLPGGQAAWRDIATAHLRGMAAHHVRPAGSTFHVCDCESRKSVDKVVLLATSAFGLPPCPAPWLHLPRPRL